MSADQRLWWIMPAMQQLTALLGAVAWPVVVVFVVVLFRRAIRDLLTRDEVSFTGPGGVAVSARRAVGALVDADEAKGERAASVSIADAADQAHEVTSFVRRLRRSPRVLWVDDRPSNNRHERWALENMGMTVELSTTTEHAQEKLRHDSYDVVVSDMARPEGPRAGYVLLDWMQRRDRSTPFVIYSSSNDPEHYDEAIRAGAIGSTARPQELVDMILRALRDARPRSRWWRGVR